MKNIIYDSENHGWNSETGETPPQKMRVCICEETLTDGSKVYDVLIPAQTAAAMTRGQAAEFAERIYKAQNENTAPLDGLTFQAD